jgi:hypothetical protein
MNLGSTIEQPSVNYTGDLVEGFSYDYGQALTTYRYFPAPGSPGARSKYCYPLALQNSSAPHLVRAGFYMNRSLFEAAEPFEFMVFFDATQWFTITSGKMNGTDHLLEIQEAIFHPQESTINICLQPVVGEIFISSLELRQLDDNMYSYPGDAVQYLSMKQRYSLGLDSSNRNLTR